MNSSEIRSKLARPELLKMQQVQDGLQVGVVMGDRLLVEPVEPHTKADELERQGLLYVPKAVKEDNTPRPSTGIVLQIGTGVTADIQPGAMVLFNKYAPMEIAMEGRKLLIVDTKDVACTLEATEDKALGDVVQPVEKTDAPDVPTQAGVPILG